MVMQSYLDYPHDRQTFYSIPLINVKYNEVFPPALEITVRVLSAPQPSNGTRGIVNEIETLKLVRPFNARTVHTHNEYCIVQSCIVKMTKNCLHLYEFTVGRS